MKEICWFQARPLCELMENRGIPIERGTKTDPLIWLDRLAAIFRHTSPQVDETNESHPCQGAITEVSIEHYKFSLKNSLRLIHFKIQSI